MIRLLDYAITRYRRRRRRRSAMTRRLLVRVCQPQQRGLAPRTTEELQACRQPIARVSHWHRDGREAGTRRKQLVVVAMGSIQIADQARRIAPRWIRERIEVIVV